MATHQYLKMNLLDPLFYRVNDLASEIFATYRRKSVVV